MNILSFDPGVSLGWAYSQNGNIITSGHYQNNSDVPVAQRLIEILNLIERMLDFCQPDLIAVEAVNRVSGTFTKDSYILPTTFGLVLMAGYDRNIRVLEISPMTIKAQFTGLGKASKQDMVRTARKITNSDIKNHNEADAIGINYTAHVIAKNNYVIPKKEKIKK